VEENQSDNKKCWICRRTKEELGNMGVELFQIDGTNYDSHTVCRVCEDIIFELGPEMSDEHFDEKVRKAIKYIFQDIIGSDEMRTE
jgi:hypothetical protein